MSNTTDKKSMRSSFSLEIAYKFKTVVKDKVPRESPKRSDPVSEDQDKPAARASAGTSGKRDTVKRRPRRQEL